MRGKHENLAGLKFGKLILLKYLGKSKWRCECECGNETTVSTSDLKNGNSTKCRTCSNRLKKGETGFNNLYSKYKIRAKNHNREFSLSKKEFGLLTSSNCHYCGVSPYKISISNLHTSEQTKKHSEYLYNGIDRIDSNKGYTLDNCIPCCEICNKAKRDISYSEFKEYINRLIEYNGKNEN